MKPRIYVMSPPRLLTGGLLVLAGVLLSLEQIGVLRSFDLGRGWPLLIVVLGLARLGSTLKDRRQQGWTLLIVGDWLFANTMTDWAYVQITLPALLTGIGLVVLIRGVGDLRDHRRRPDPGGRSGGPRYSAQQWQ